MSSRNKVIVFGVTLILIICLLTIYLAIPKIIINLNGSKNEIIKLGEEYIELGATAYYKNIFYSENINLETTGVVNNKKIGKYKINYKANYHNIIKEETRVIEVLDDEKPVLTIQKEITACKRNGKIDINVVARDNYDGDITDKIIYKVIDDKVYISVSDSSNNTTEVEKNLNYIDNENPTLTLKGSKDIYLKKGEQYTELGVEAYDSCDGDISNNITITGTVNSNEFGIYEITYKVKDSMDNEVTINRLIHVVDNDNLVVNNAVIYLTFDDGPGIYTEQILNILDSYNIKATFFVTNQFPKYQYLINTEYEKGHTVGIHTYSHNIKSGDRNNIYNTLESYLNDFNKMQEIVKNQTGTTTKYFRFPGGTSNHRAKVGMSYLADYMKELGYVYFDWHIDSGDTHPKNTKEYIINLVKSHLKGNGSYIILMHDIKKNTVEALPEIISYAKQKGYIFSKIDDNTPLKQFKAYN